MHMRRGRASLVFEHPPVIEAAASVAGKKEGEGPLRGRFDLVAEDDRMGKKTWEEAESAMQEAACRLALKKGGLERGQIQYLFAGDLLGQLIATSFGVADLEIPLFGLYGACSTIGEALCLGAMTVAAGYGERVLTVSSSHFATAEKQFRFPLGYGNQRPWSSTWTVTGSGAFVLASEEAAEEKSGPAGEKRGFPEPGQGGKPGGRAVISAVTVGKIADMGVKDSMNMGAAMAPAAYSTISRNFMDLGVGAEAYDRIITGDLGRVGSQALMDFMRAGGRDLSAVHMDCGLEIYDCAAQDTHAGGSGCGCSAVTLAASILGKVESGEWRRVLFVPTGALLSTVSFNEGRTIPGIAHGVVIEHRGPGERRG
ncbi:MAG TPA: stage V sporulation protein AD [Candidatus Lachnoclostridium stercoripullorum]|uniref:Stage V sporulation protein AD n=1 Tax=Candidatus Lachnoclostridium stercoripullorum TaxID=2838635 RepID=A0A9D2AWT2_9FIRM|nr:stage V sporulation protein AD [Candidatus Lachnoclostridium stercoripullorum]